MHVALCKISNVSFFDDQWLQARLPVESGGQRLRHVVSLAPPAFIASAVGITLPTNQNLQCCFQMPNKVVEY